VHTLSKACRHTRDADLAARIAAGKGDVPLVQLKWRCGNRGLRLPEFIGRRFTHQAAERRLLTLRPVNVLLKDLSA
jgi:hypothetical protein